MHQISLAAAHRTEVNRRKPPIYKVLLHNDNYNRREYVVKILLKIIEGMTVDDAVNVMQVSWIVCVVLWGEPWGISFTSAALSCQLQFTMLAS
jgi:hypothetical protein